MPGRNPLFDFHFGLGRKLPVEGLPGVAVNGVQLGIIRAVQVERRGTGAHVEHFQAVSATVQLLEFCGSRQVELRERTSVADQMGEPGEFARIERVEGVVRTFQHSDGCR